jgi:hypothetical protein
MIGHTITAPKETLWMSCEREEESVGVGEDWFGVAVDILDFLQWCSGLELSLPYEPPY